MSRSVYLKIIMGLCKCPKKKVTNLFCYEHRVNVCQNCMVKHHSKCIVQSYLQWLQDSDYNPNCVICEDKLISEECVRLVCLHVYHWKCLDKKYRQLPSTTAPAGYKCLQCEESIFPLSNVATPVADQLRDKLATVNWARLALGLPTVTEENKVMEEPNFIAKPNHVNHLDDTVNMDRKSDNDLVLYLDEPVYSRPEESAKMPRRIMANFSNTKMLLVDEDEKKDRRRYPLSWLSRWIRCIGSRIRYPGRDRHGKIKLIILGVLTIALLFSILSILGRKVTEDDPAFDPLNNPHVHLKDTSA